MIFFLFKQKTAYEVRISDWSSDVCSSDLHYRTDKIRNVGEAPRLLDSSLIEISRNQIERFLASKGYFNAKVKDSIAIKKQKASITFQIGRASCRERVCKYV